MELPASGSAESRSLAFVIKLKGEFDLSDCDRLREVLSVPSSANLVVIDLRATTYIDSSVLKCLFELRNRTHERGAELVLVGLTPSVKRILEVCSFDTLFDVREGFGEISGSTAFEAADVRTLTLTARAHQADP